jgi:tetratricopeptide repeat protein 8
MWHALSKMRKGKYEECIAMCNVKLDENPNDQAFWALKCRAVVQQSWVDDVELDEGVDIAESLLDDHAVASLPRPGTSMNAPRAASKTPSQSLRPVTNGGRPLSGFARPGSSSSEPASGDLRDALQSSSRRLGTAAARPMTNLGREVRLGTASLAHSATGSLVDVARLNIKKYASRTGIAMQLVDYLLYVERNPRKALELCAEATKGQDFKDWWCKARLAKCYSKLGLLRDAERQYKSSLKDQPIIDTYLELAIVYVRLDLPNTALDILHQGMEKFSLEPRLLVAVARIHESLNNMDESVSHYKRVLALDASNVEALACIGAHHFYSDQPEMAQRFYRRLLQMGINSSPLFNNMGLCCFYSSQYDMALSCFERALSLASDEEMADIWYNVGHMGVALGDLGLAYQAFKVSVSIDPAHSEALNNIAVLETRRKKNGSARNFYALAIEANEFQFESHFNLSVMAMKQGDFQEAYTHSKKASEIYPAHLESKELKEKLQRMFLASMA